MMYPIAGEGVRFFPPKAKALFQEFINIIIFYIFLLFFYFSFFFFLSFITLM